MFVSTISRPSSNMGHVGSKTRSPVQILGNSCLLSRGHISDLSLMELGQNVCFDNIQAKFEQGSCRVKNEVTRSNLWKFLFTLYRVHICDHILMKHSQNVCFDNIQTKFEYGSCRVKNKVARSNFRKFLFTLLGLLLSPDFDETWSECLF